MEEQQKDPELEQMEREIFKKGRLVNIIVAIVFFLFLAGVVVGFLYFMIGFCDMMARGIAEFYTNLTYRM